jgi:hypothetical protein
MQGGL